MFWFHFRLELRVPATKPITMSASPFKVEGRKYQDVIFGIAYIGVYLASFIICMTQLDPATKFVQNEVNCVKALHDQIDKDPSASLSSNSGDEFMYDIVNALNFLNIPAWGAFVFGAAWMWALYKFAKPVVYFTLALKGIVMVSLGIFLFAVTEQVGFLIFALLVTALYGLMLWCMRNKIHLTAKLIAQSVVVVTAHPQIFSASLRECPATPVGCGGWCIWRVVRRCS